MPAYRFCRTDDIPFLAHALNACYGVHFADSVALSADDFKREIRELDIWASSCMAATENGEPIGVVTGAKREHETLIHRVGVHPDHLRRGHALHLLESLSHKLSVLGPPRVVAEIPDDRPEVRALFEAAGFVAEGSFADFTLPTPLEAAPEAQVEAVGLEEIVRCEAFDPRALRSWQRSLETLQNRKDQMRGLAVAGATGVEAGVLFRDLAGESRREIVTFGGTAAQGDGPRDAQSAQEVAIRAACQAGALCVTVPRVSDGEMRWAELEKLGFLKARTYTLYADHPGTRLH